MTTFELVLVLIYWPLATTYMWYSMGFEETKSIEGRVFTFLCAITLGVIWFPATLGGDLYKKLNENNKKIETAKKSNEEENS